MNNINLITESAFGMLNLNKHNLLAYYKKDIRILNDNNDIEIKQIDKNSILVKYFDYIFVNSDSRFINKFNSVFNKVIANKI